MKWVVIAILSALCVALLVYGVRIYRKIKKKGIRMYIFEKAYGPVVAIHKCNLFLATEEYGEKIEYIYDFSRYEDYGIIGFVMRHPNGPPRDENGDYGEKVGCLVNQKVYEFEDGTMLWLD